MPASNNKLTAIAARDNHTCALLQDGRLKCWGLNEDGQLGLGDRESRGANFGQMGDALFPIPLGSEKRVIAIAPRAFHSCALLHDGTLKCWGANFAGQLGLGDIYRRGDNPGEMGDSLLEVMLR